MTLTTAIKRFLVLPTALVLATYSSIISLELLADVYTPAEDIDHAESDRLHREKIMTRTVSCFDDCDNFDRWSAFARLSGTKQRYTANEASDQPQQRSKQTTITAGIDRTFGDHLLGFALGSSNGDADLHRKDRSRSEIERDKKSLGIYYGVLLSRYINISAQLLYSDYDYSSKLSGPGSSIDFAEYDAHGYSSGAGLSTIIPMKMKSSGSEFIVQPSINYLYVKTKNDDYSSEANEYYAKSELVTSEWRFALKWRKPINTGEIYLFPMAGISYSMLDRKFRSNGDTERRDQEYFEGLLGISVQRLNLNFSAAYQRTIGADNYERKQYQVSFRMEF